MAKPKQVRPLAKKSIEKLQTRITTASEQVANNVMPKHKVAERPFVVERVPSHLFKTMQELSEVEYPKYSHGESHDHAVAIQKGLLLGYVLGKQLFPDYRRQETLDEKVAKELERIQTSPYGIDHTLRIFGPLHIEKFTPLITLRLAELDEDPRAIGASGRLGLYAGSFGYIAAIGIEELFIEEMRTTTGNLSRRDAKRMAAQAETFATADLTENDIEPSW